MTNYYVSNSGSDPNDGLTPATAWQTIAKVNGFVFQPGDRILLESGGEWREQLTPTASGLPCQYVYFGSYGAGAKPVINGADIIDNVGWTLDSGTTYCQNLPAINDIVHNGAFLSLVADKATVGTTPNSWFWDSGTTELCVNVGGAPTGVFENCVRDTGVHITDLSWIKVDGLEARNFARLGAGSADAGYGFLFQMSSRIIGSNLDAYNCQKHHLGDISCEGVRWSNVYANGIGNMLDASGASAFVTFAAAAQTTSGDTVWVDALAENMVDARDGIERSVWIGHGDGQRKLRVINMTGPALFSIEHLPTGGPDDSWEYHNINVNDGRVIFGINTDNARACDVTITGNNAQIWFRGDNNTAENVTVSQAGVSTFDPVRVDGANNTINGVPAVTSNVEPSQSGTCLGTTSATNVWAAASGLMQTQVVTLHGEDTNDIGIEFSIDSLPQYGDLFCSPDCTNPVGDALAIGDSIVNWDSDGDECLIYVPTSQPPNLGFDETFNFSAVDGVSSDQSRADISSGVCWLPNPELAAQYQIAK